MSSVLQRRGLDCLGFLGSMLNGPSPHIIIFTCHMVIFRSHGVVFRSESSRGLRIVQLEDVHPSWLSVMPIRGLPWCRQQRCAQRPGVEEWGTDGCEKGPHRVGESLGWDMAHLDKM